LTRIVILGSCRFAPYVVLAMPNPLSNAYNTDEGYIRASKIFYPAINEADIVIVYAPDGIGKHTELDIRYAKSLKKKVVIII
jgi:hypothetical protein